MGKLLALKKLVAVRTLKKSRSKQRLLAETKKKIEKIFLETMDIAAKQRDSAERARLQLIKDEIAALVPKNGRLTNKWNPAHMAARRKPLKINFEKLRIIPKRKLEEEEKIEIAASAPNNGCLTYKVKTKGMAARRKLKKLRIKRRLEEKKRKMEEEKKRKLEEEEKRKLEEEKIEMFQQTILWRLSGFY